jgi:alpha-tubulin suppressor-like RCC1 family protein
MSLKKDVFRLNRVYDLVNSGLFLYETEDPLEPGELYSWGSNSLGELGLNDRINRSSPVQIPGTTWTSFTSLGYGNANLSTKNNCTLWAWGSGSYLGQNNLIHRSSPVQIPGTTWLCVTDKSMSGGRARKTNGTTWVWGPNSAGQLGLNNTINRSSPVQIPGNWAIGPGGPPSGRSLAIKPDATLWVWGDNTAGRLGLGDNINRSSPIQIPGTWSSFFGGSYVSGGLKTDGTLWIWGCNLYGTVGDNTSIHRCSPVQVPGTNWKQVCTGYGDVLGVKTDGTLWGWGYGRWGTSMQGVAPPSSIKSSPVQIPGNNWLSIDMGYDAVAARKTDGTTWMAGRSNNGQIGLNTTTYATRSPVQLPGKWRGFSGIVGSALGKK